jgi:putative tryptophan/tyrosine transport system substrate-binding protein
MRRREFIAGLGGAAVAWPRTVRAQQVEGVRRIGVLMWAVTEVDLGPFREELAKLGWVEGRNLLTEYRASARDPALLAANAEALVDLHPDVIVAVTGPAIRAVETRTQTIPIVFAGGGDSVDNRYATSVGRPVGNVTGFANRVSSLGGRYVELLKEAVPNITRIAHVFAGAAPVVLSAAIDAAALQLGITIVRIPLGNPIETEVAISAFRCRAQRRSAADRVTTSSGCLSNAAAAGPASPIAPDVGDRKGSYRRRFVVACERRWSDSSRRCLLC